MLITERIKLLAVLDVQTTLYCLHYAATGQVVDRSISICSFAQYVFNTRYITIEHEFHSLNKQHRSSMPYSHQSSCR